MKRIHILFLILGLIVVSLFEWTAGVGRASLFIDVEEGIWMGRIARETM